MKSLRFCGLVAVGALLLTGCSEKKWTAEGTVSGAEGKSMVLEAPNAAGGWYPVDTVEIGKNGSFSVEALPFGHPELLRLNLGGNVAYFPIDSLETVTITADAASFGSAKLSGSPSAERMQEVNDLIAKSVKANGAENVAFDMNLKRQLAEIVLRDPADIVAYYIIFHSVGGNRIFSPTEKSDLRIIGAVANNYTHSRPSDPRTKLLQDLYLSNRRDLGLSRADTIVVDPIKFPEIKLFDEKGKEQSLTATASKGNVVILCFTAYGAEGSTALNVELNKVWTAHRAQGLDIYQVALDEDEFQWKQSAKNLPWTTVYNSPKAGAEVLVNYNVQTLPALFILNREGDLVERVEAPNRLESAVNRYL